MRRLGKRAMTRPGPADQRLPAAAGSNQSHAVVPVPVPIAQAVAPTSRLAPPRARIARTGCAPRDTEGRSVASARRAQHTPSINVPARRHRSIAVAPRYEAWLHEPGRSWRTAGAHPPVGSATLLVASPTNFATRRARVFCRASCGAAIRMGTSQLTEMRSRGAVEDKTPMSPDAHAASGRAAAINIRSIDDRACGRRGCPAGHSRMRARARARAARPARRGTARRGRARLPGWRRHPAGR